MLRSLRQKLVSSSTRIALHCAPRVSARVLEQVGALLGLAGPWCPVVSAAVAENMRRAGVYTAARHRAYFAHAGRHLAGALHALRCAADATQGARALAEVAAEHIILDDSVTRFAGAVAGRGAILVGPHVANYLLGLTRLNQAAPLTVYLRYSRDALRRAAKQRWYDTSGVAWISEPAEAGGSLGRLGRMAAALDAGRTLFITPDLPQKRSEGWPAMFMGREIALPAGPALLAVRSGAPLFVLEARVERAGQRLCVRGPFNGEMAERGRAARQRAVQERVQWFADELAGFLRRAPELWYLWGDKRWTRVFRGDPRYSRRGAGGLAGAGMEATH